MSYSERTENRVGESVVVNPVVDYHDRVRWGPIFAGIVVAISTQLVLSALGAAIGLSAGASGTNAGDAALGVGIWAIISLLIALFLGGWVMARTCGPMNSKTALLNGAILWATTLAISSWLLASGVSGTFGVVASNAGEIINQAQQSGGVNVPNNAPNINNAEARNIAGNTAKAAWSFIFGSLLGLVASMIGASVGARKPGVRAV
ncbi:MAG: hypothetical protein KME19_09895 [Microcoleus vaginatus WJT46-NPBG5]|jgi:hypothetical protein|nr:hypothetical protein [Microcoleus vaginatus WJT46-NPBG5]